MSAALTAVHCLASVVVLAEALNKLHRSDPLERGLGWRGRVVEALKVAAWFLLAIGAGGGLITPLLHLESASLMDVCTALGFSVLIVRTRIKEG